MTTLSINRASHITLNDGRRLTYEEHGAPGGYPVLLFHGVPGSRLQRHPDASLAEQANVRLITTDRPGFGLSDPMPRRTLLDWPHDVGQLAHALGLGKFSVIGVSGGGVFALACAHKLGPRIERVVLASSPAPLQVPGTQRGLPIAQRLQFALAARAPWAMRLMLAGYLRSAAKLTPEAIRRKLSDELPSAEKPHLTTPGFVEMMLADTIESARNGPGPIAAELSLIARPWGFSLGEITAPVTLWQGEEDNHVTAEMGAYLARTLPNCQAIYCPGEGHLVGFTHWEEIIQQVAKQGGRQA